MSEDGGLDNDGTRTGGAGSSACTGGRNGGGGLSGDGGDGADRMGPENLSPLTLTPHAGGGPAVVVAQDTAPRERKAADLSTSKTVKSFEDDEEGGGSARRKVKRLNVACKVPQKAGG
ncbi:hypothetical protein GPECTOR_5g39 [Gonium pectorale]|uniref:Uncharacterized protein n=1 Tax=Gonium pectorale TaxID=33097 RepID=A0A150GWX0_GONPE|nr:hypothetical protein GPECTOR_5g39 [Gonium pectorale]|eukprot:KXZ54304.1 hypothetical protein GPECTOR_5g39 [Gonium pectorale]